MKYYLIFIFLFFLISCNDRENNIKKEWTVMLYMMSDNDLDRYAPINIKQLEKSIDINTTDVYVFIDRSEMYTPTYPVILKIVKDEAVEIISPIIRKYEEENSASLEMLNDFINFVKNKSNSKKYLLSIWSHGFGWFPDPYSLKPSSYYLGVDTNPNSYLSIPDIAKAIPDDLIDILILDACEVADIEVAYELRNKAKYMIASQTEVLADGMPYHNFLKQLSNNYELEELAKQLAKDYFEYYSLESEPNRKSATISVVKMSNIEALADTYLKVYSKYNLSDLEKIKTIGNTQKTTRRSAYKNYRLDMLDYINNSKISLSDKANIRDIYLSTVIYSKNTPYLLNSLKLDNISGLNIFATQKSTDKALIDYYLTLEFGKKTKSLL